MLDAQPLFVPGYRAESLEGRLDANYLIVRRKAAQGNLGGFFRFWRSIMQPGTYRSSSSGEHASERPMEQGRLTVKQSGQMPVRRFESCPSHCKSADGIPVPSSPNWSGTGLLSRLESVRVRPMATSDCAGQKL